ncbi:MAG: hypothetical protein QW711_02735 [Candidatus Korarchaeum sp.]
MKRLLALTLALIILPLSPAAAQPKDKEAHPRCKEWSDGFCVWTEEDEELLRQIEEYEKQNPRVFIPEANVFVPGRGYVTDEQGRFLIEGYADTIDRYYDSRGRNMYVTTNDKLKFGKVYWSTFVATYISIFHIDGSCLACGLVLKGVYRSKEWIKNYADQQYPNVWGRIHVKYFIQAIVRDYVYCIDCRKNAGGSNRVALDVVGPYYPYRYAAELWSEANCRREGQTCRWVTYGFPDDPDGGAARILNKAIVVSVGFAYYGPFPNLYSRRFGSGSNLTTLYSRFWHQFALNGVSG